MSARDERSLHVFTARMPAELFDGLRAYAFFAGRSVNEVVVAAIGDYLRTHATDEALDALVEQTRVKVRRTLERLDEG